MSELMGLKIGISWCDLVLRCYGDVVRTRVEKVLSSAGFPSMWCGGGRSTKRQAVSNEKVQDLSRQAAQNMSCLILEIGVLSKIFFAFIVRTTKHNICWDVV